MPLPRPASPRALWADLRAFTAQRSRHQWIAAGVAATIPCAFIFAFVLDVGSIKREPQLIYVESWSLERSDAEIVADQKQRQAEKEAAQKQRREELQRLSDRMEKIGI